MHSSAMKWMKSAQMKAVAPQRPIYHNMNTIRADEED